MPDHRKAPTSRRPPLRYRFDGSGAWFATIASTGENMDIRFGKKLHRRREIEWVDGVSHAQFDGMGGFVRLLRRNGYPGFASFPHLKDGDRPVGLLEWLKLTARKRRPGGANLRTSLATDPARPAAARNARAKRHPATSVVFAEEETRLFLHGARASGVTLNTLLLLSLNQALRKVLADPSADFPWMIPVNMRGGVELADKTANHSSMIDLPCLHGDNLRTLHARVQELLASKRHWWHWHYLQLTARTGKLGRAKLLRLQRSQRKAIGSFSNLGNWELPAHPHIEAWLFAPPVSRRQTLGAGCLTTYGRLSLTLQIHGSVPGAKVLAMQIVEEWQQCLRQCARLPAKNLHP